MTLEALDPEDRDRLHRLVDRYPDETPAALSARFATLANGYRPSVILTAAGQALGEREEKAGGEGR